MLVQLAGDPPTWHGPEREPGDGIEVVPLPAGYHWEATGGFEALPNGEAWWAESSLVGTACLIGPGGTVLVEVPLQIAFRSEGGDLEPGPEPTPT